MMKNQFNLVIEPWIPVAGKGLVSLEDIFTDSEITALGGSPIQKIAVTKLLLAIAQAAWTPKDEAEWEKVGSDGVAKKAMTYLKKNKDLFWLYGEKPFLQTPLIEKLIKKRTNEELKKAKTQGQKIVIEKNGAPKNIGAALIPDLPSENNTILTQNQLREALSDAEKALFLITLMNFALGGKRVEKDVPSLSPSYSGKTDSAKAGPSIGNHWGYLHSYLLATNIIDTVWLNILTQEQINEYKPWSEGLGVAPWEQMPSGESCKIANKLKKSYMGCLVSFCRFVFLKEDGIYYVEGLQYPSHKAGWREPTITIDESNVPPKLLWVDPSKRPWRELTALLSFMGTQSSNGFECRQIRWTIKRTKQLQKFNIWSGGLKVRATAGDQSVKQDDDFVESEVHLEFSYLGSNWFSNLKQEMEELEKLSKVTYGATMGFFKAQKTENKKRGAQAANLFWQLCERKFQKLVDACNMDAESDRKKLRGIFAGFVNKSYDTYCPKDTARQLNAWAANRPNLAKYLA